MVRTDDGIIGSIGGVFGDRHGDTSIFELEALSEWVCWKEARICKVDGFPTGTCLRTDVQTSVLG